MRRQGSLSTASTSCAGLSAWTGILLLRPFTLAPPKTQASYRTGPLPKVIVDALAAHLAEFPAGDHGLVFTRPGGAPLNRNNLTLVFRKVAAAVGAPEGTRLHDLRHYYASLLIAHGESVKVVQERLGHASAAETLDTYTHLFPDSADTTRAAVDAALGGATADTVRTEETS